MRKIHVFMFNKNVVCVDICINMGKEGDWCSNNKYFVLGRQTSFLQKWFSGKLTQVTKVI